MRQSLMGHSIHADSAPEALAEGLPQESTCRLCWASMQTYASL